MDTVYDMMLVLPAKGPIMIAKYLADSYKTRPMLDIIDLRGAPFLWFLGSSYSLGIFSEVG